jgi:hypothetical protein
MKPLAAFCASFLTVFIGGCLLIAWLMAALA